MDRCFTCGSSEGVIAGEVLDGLSGTAPSSIGDGGSHCVVPVGMCQ